MKKQTKIMIVILAIISLGVYYGYQKYSFNKKQQTSSTEIKSNQTVENSTDEKSKKIITDQVNKAETSRTEADVASAKKAVETLPPGADKDALTKKINAIAINDGKATDFITNAQYVEELFSSTLYVEIKNSSKVKGVTVAGTKLVLDDRYIVENGKVKIVFKKGTPKDSIGKVVINTVESDYEVKTNIIK
jgi:hypothetical protein